jgi:sulfite exporter TauE/SafE
MEIYLAALSLGFLGSFHCIGMCGPIALALPLNKNSFLARLAGGVIYNFGRMLTYALFGGLFGLIGQSFALAGYQQWLSIAMGLLLLIMVFLPESAMNKFQLSHEIYSLIGKLKSKFSKLLLQKNYSSLFLIGLLNGLLPCGLVYLGIVGAIATGDSLQGSLFMAVFGLGTLPAMLSLSLISNSISLNFRNKIRKAIPAFIVVMGIMLILRGLNLGIPYLSPKMSKTDPTAHECCHKN